MHNSCTITVACLLTEKKVRGDFQCISQETQHAATSPLKGAPLRISRWPPLKKQRPCTDKYRRWEIRRINLQCYRKKQGDGARTRAEGGIGKVPCVFPSVIWSICHTSHPRCWDFVRLTDHLNISFSLCLYVFFFPFFFHFFFLSLCPKSPPPNRWSAAINLEPWKYKSIDFSLSASADRCWLIILVQPPNIETHSRGTLGFID